MYTVELLAEAEQDVSDACEWYEDKQNGLAARFLNELDHYLDLISTNPLQFEVRFSERYRVATLKVFPFLIVYRIDDQHSTIYVISVFHTSRNPSRFK